MNAPAFQHYAADFLANRNVAVMSAEEVGAYWLLVNYCWREGTLPDDMEELASLSRVPLERFQASWDKRIGRCFQKEGNTWLHPGLEAERLKQAENREKKRAAANKRHHPNAPPDMHEQCTSNADAEQVQCPSSSTSSSTAQKKDSRRDAAASKKNPNVIWDLGVQMLVNVGWTEPNARSFLGRQEKEYGKQMLTQAIAATSGKNAVNPHEYLVKTLQELNNGTPKNQRFGKPEVTRDLSIFPDAA